MVACGGLNYAPVLGLIDELRCSHWAAGRARNENAHLWYEHQQSGLGRKFVSELDIVFERISSTPYIYADIYKGIRRPILRRFPVAVFVS